MAVSMKPFKYADKRVPEGYTCQDCGATGVKLWREYMVVMSFQELRCRKCAEKNQVEAIKKQEEFFTKYGLVHRPHTDQIGELVPAVPTEEGDTFWGYTSVPDAAVEWWKELPE